MASSPQQRLTRLWNKLSRLPGGRWIFSRGFGLAVPYSGSIHARVEHLAPGECRVSLRDHRSVRNHLDSVHAVALVNLGEMTSGLAMTMALEDGIRGIVTSISCQYSKKARGRLMATAEVAVPAVGTQPLELEVKTSITDQAGDTVCIVTSTWRLERIGSR